MTSLISSIKNYKKKERERRVLFGVVELYIATGRPVGSQALKEAGFEDLSSATIRNYFSKLEKEGYLLQQHSSGGRTPTDLAFEYYAQEHRELTYVEKEIEQELSSLRQQETQQISAYLQQAAAKLSRLTGYAVFLSSPRFEQDFIEKIYLVVVDTSRCLAILLTHFGMIHTEQLYIEQKLSIFTRKRLEEYFDARLKNLPLPEKLTVEELKLAQQLYNEILMRYIITLSQPSQEEIYSTGFSQLLNYPEFSHAKALASSLALFENHALLYDLLNETMQEPQISIWIGEKLKKFIPIENHCTILSIPYRVNQMSIGAFGILGPVRMPYRKVFGILNLFTTFVSEMLTRNVHKFKIQFRKANAANFCLNAQNQLLIEQRKK